MSFLKMIKKFLFVEEIKSANGYCFSTLPTTIKLWEEVIFTIWWKRCMKEFSVKKIFLCRNYFCGIGNTDSCSGPDYEDYSYSRNSHTGYPSILQPEPPPMSCFYPWQYHSSPMPPMLMPPFYHNERHLRLFSLI